MLKFIVPICMLSIGCQVLPRYQSTAASPHKDALLLNIYLMDRADLETYRWIVQAELQKLQQAPKSPGIPLYEIRFEFRQQAFPQDKMAMIVVHLDGGASPRLYSRALPRPESWETYLY